MTTFGQRIRELRQAKKWTLRELAPKVGVGFTYLSKVENGKLDFGDYPSEALIHRLAGALEANEDELMILSDRVPQKLKERIKKSPELFCRVAELDDDTLSNLLEQVN